MTIQSEFGGRIRSSGGFGAIVRRRTRTEERKRATRAEQSRVECLNELNELNELICPFDFCFPPSPLPAAQLVEGPSEATSLE